MMFMLPSNYSNVKKQKFYLISLISICVVTIFLSKQNYFISTNNNFIEVHCNSNVNVAISFRQLLEYGLELSNDYDFAIVFPDNIKIIDEFLNIFCDLIDLLHNNSLIEAISGRKLLHWEPICTLDKINWTVKMRHEFSKFADGTVAVTLNGTPVCYACDLLPDIFVIRLKSLRKFRRNFSDLTSLNNSAHLPFFLLLKGRSAYCPEIKIKLNAKFEDYSCNHLFSRWDPSVALVPNVSQVIRLISPDNTEAWLGCVWSRKAYDLDLPIYCSNFVRQYLFDIVDILDKELLIDYRIEYGTLLAALRHKDVIPWSVDVDIRHNLSFMRNIILRFFHWRKLHIYSSRRYSHLARDNLDHYAPLRAFPACPVVLSSRQNDMKQVYNESRNNLIHKILDHIEGNVSYNSDWRSFGYVDLYKADDNPICFDCFSKKPNFAEINKRMFKSIHNAIERVNFLYGNESLLKLPKIASTEWLSFID